jgi:gliding motility associated protien GldN
MNMKRWWLMLGLVALFSFVANDVSAQKKKAKKKTYNTKKKNTTKVQEPVVQTPVIENTVAADSLAVNLPKVLPSLRATTSAKQTIDSSGRKNEKIPLAYENLREDDELYKQVLWRNINIREKMNLPFSYEADEDNGNQRFINILLKTLKEGVNDSTPLVAFSGLDDRFTTPMKLGEISNLLVGSADTIQVPDWGKDPTGSLGLTKDSIIANDFNPDLVETFQIKEEIIFDRKTSRLHRRTLGIAPLKKSIDAAGNLRGEFPIFWLYYPDLRPVLAKYEAYNPRNGANRLSWEEVFESHYFSSYIVKSTMSNNGNKYINQMIQDPILRLVESDNIKEQIFNFEQSQWSY